MPYIAIKSFPKDKTVKQMAVERICEVVSEVLGCSRNAITISYEEIVPSDWEENVIKAEIEPNMKTVMILSGEKKF